MPEYDAHGASNHEAAKARVAEIRANRKPPKPEHLDRAERITKVDDPQRKPE